MSIVLTHLESIPMIFSLIEAGREMAYQQLESMARKADAFGKDLEIVVLPHDELTGQFQVMLIAVGTDEPILLREPLLPEQVDFCVDDLQAAYPSAEVVRV